MHRDARSYYEDPSTGGQYPTGQYSSPGHAYPLPEAYNPTTYDYHDSPQYYPPDTHPNGGSQPAYRNMSPALHPQRYSTSFNYPQPALLTSSAPLHHSYNAQAYYNDQYPSNSLGNRSPPNQTQFIPTPSDMASSYPNYPQTLPPYSPTAAPYGPRVNVYSKPVSGPPQRPRTSRISIGRARTASGATISPTSATSPSGERFPCEDCGKTFSRSHDRKRHQETLHLPNSVSHRCRYCEKEFSRADSLKRHLDNGCDEMPR